MAGYALEVLPPQYQVNSDCPHFSRGFCGYTSGLVGRLSLATGVRCSSVCQAEPEAHAAELSARILPKEYDWRFIGRTWAKWGKGESPIVIPGEWSEIRERLSTLANKPYVRSVLLTGSMLKPQDDYKDYDIAVLLKDVAWSDRSGTDMFLSDAYGNDNIMPKTISSHNVDYFVWTRLSPFFPSLDCSTGTVYLPLFPYTPYRPGTARVVQQDASLWTPEQFAQLTEIASKAQAYADELLAEKAAQSSSSSSGAAPEAPVRAIRSAIRESGSRGERKGCGCGRSR